ncbi:hypothetical protein [Kocuria rosea]|uniref:hypothetical protein n=1 Tax=Kocuria rosea TaxID=1275 RepID=UPI00119DDC9A|nr:hypothetical protein [Kocuria rosea]
MRETPTRARVNIALTGPAELARDEVNDRFPFREKQQLVRLGLAYALRLNLEPVRDAHFGRAGDGQNMNVGSFDPSGELFELVRAFHPDQRNVAEVAETLMSLGLVRLAEDIRNSEVSRIADILYSGNEPA